jgi:hypothetical protein
LGKIGNVQPWDKRDNRVYEITDVDVKLLQFNSGIGYALTEASIDGPLRRLLKSPSANQVAKAVAYNSACPQTMRDKSHAILGVHVIVK